MDRKKARALLLSYELRAEMETWSDDKILAAHDLTHQIMDRRGAKKRDQLADAIARSREAHRRFVEGVPSPSPKD